MRKYKEDIKTIIQVLMFGITCLNISTIDNPFVSIIVLGLWIVYMIYHLISKLQYTKGNANYILFPTINDQYSKISSLTLGVIICVLSILSLVGTNDFKLYGAVGFLVGVLIFCNGLFELPKGMLKIEGNEMYIVGLDRKMDIRQIKELKIYNDRMELINANNDKHRLEYLKINLVSAEQIEKYILNHKMVNNLNITNNVC